jgi:hypothetical protein
MILDIDRVFSAEEMSVMRTQDSAKSLVEVAV